MEMKKLIIYLMLTMLCPVVMMAQSSMTDEQVMQFAAKEHEAGTSNAQIVTKLMQRGVDIQQIRRVRSKYERQIKQSGLGNMADKTQADVESRMRKNNGKTKEYDNEDNLKRGVLIRNRC